MTKQPATIWIIDDDPDIAEALKIVLELEGFQVKAHSDAKILPSLLSAQQKEPPQLIILDILLSGIDGRDLARLLKQNPQTRDIPILLISAHPTALNGLTKEVADACLPKPFKIQDLLRTVSEFMGLTKISPSHGF
jgi:two-component system alkaline phosphatase synthesis response regulator PhoP